MGNQRFKCVCDSYSDLQKMCLTQDLQCLTQDSIFRVSYLCSYLLVTGTFSCVLRVSDRFSEYKENPENTGFSGFVALSRYSVELSLAELRSATSCFETVFLTFFHTWITCQVSSFLKNWSVLSICLQEVLLRYHDGLLQPVLCIRHLLR